MLFGIHTVHSEKRACEKRRFLAACAAADFNDNVFLIVRVLRQQQNFKLFLTCSRLSLVFFNFRAEHFLKIAVGFFGKHLLCFIDGGLCRLILSEFFHNRRYVRMFLAELSPFCLVCNYFGIAYFACKLLVSFLYKFQFAYHPNPSVNFRA